MVQLCHSDEVCACAIAYFLSDPERSRFLVDKYLESSANFGIKETVIENKVDPKHCPACGETNLKHVNGYYFICPTCHYLNDYEMDINNKYE